MLGTEPAKQPLIQIVTETQQTETVEVPKVVEIKDPNGCEPAMYWAAEAPYYCIPKPVAETTTIAVKATRSPVNSSSSALNTYELYSCTWGVKNWKPEVGNDNGNANNWGYALAAKGWTVSDTPVIGAVAWTTRGAYGHVALVVGVSSNQVTVKEQNFDWNGSIRTITVPVSSYRYIY